MILESDFFVRLLGPVKLNMVVFTQIFVCIMRVLVVRKALYVTI